MRQPLGFRWFMAAVLAWSVAGCGGRNAKLPPLVPVDGTITLDGQLLEGAYVVFDPIGDTPGTGAAGITDSQGRYELTALDGFKGAPVGEYQVAVSKLVMPDGSLFSPADGVAPMDSPAREVVPERYNTIEQTILRAAVPAEGGTIDLTLTSKR